VLDRETHIQRTLPHSWQQIQISNKMADDVCESWEQLIEDNSTAKNNAQNAVTKKSKEFSYSSALNKNLSSTSKVLNNSSNDHSTGSNQSKSIQITFEDVNTRNQFNPSIFMAQQQNSKVKILQRPKDDQTKNSNGTNILKNGFQNARTIAEREAEYRKARERILGADYKNEDEVGSESINSLSNRTNETTNLVRAPQGPNNSNFSQRR